jgi:hypothetical protein
VINVNRHSLRGGFATAAARARPLGGRDHAPRALEECANRPPLHPPGAPAGTIIRQPRSVYRNAGHSLRRGFVTNAAKKKIPIENER